MTSSETIQVIGTGYVGTLQGGCKFIEFVASFIAVLLVTLDFKGWIIDLFQAVTVGSSMVAFVFLVLYITGVVARIPLPMNRVQFFFHICWAFFYIAAIGLLYDAGSSYTKIIVGGVFGIIAVMAHIVDGVDNYQKQPLCRRRQLTNNTTGIVNNC